MMNFKKILTGAVLGVAVLGAGMFLNSAQAQPAPAAGKATVIRTVDMLKAFQKMQQRTDSDNELTALGEKLKKEGEKLRSDLEPLQKELAQYTVDTPEFRATQEKLLKKAAEIQTHQEFFERRMAMQSRLMTLSIYMNLKKAIEAYAKENGIDMVIMAEEANLADSQSAQELQMKISLRKVLYANENLDITQQVVTKVNGDWLKERPKTP
jgi:Skp family chaperone for outer membrane proteins